MTDNGAARDLHPIPLTEALIRPAKVVTMSAGQWDAWLSAAYDMGWILLEVDDDECPVRAYRKLREGCEK